MGKKDPDCHHWYTQRNLQPNHSSAPRWRPPSFDISGAMADCSCDALPWNEPCSWVWPPEPKTRMFISEGIPPLRRKSCSDDHPLAQLSRCSTAGWPKRS